jgi:methyl-accepting chemotaxis protein I, serine sensor receptor
MRRSLRWTLLALALPSAFAAVVILALSFSSFQQLDRSAREALVAKDVVADILPPPMYLIEMRLVLSQAVERSVTPAEARQRFDKLASEYAQRASYWRDHPPHGLEKLLLGAQHAHALRFIEQSQSGVLDRVAAGDQAGAEQALKQADLTYRAHRQAVDETVAAGGRFADRAMEEFSAVTARGYWQMPLAAAVLLAASAALGLGIFRRLVSAVRECSAVARQVAAGDLTQKVKVRRADELGDLIGAMNEMSDNLMRIVGGVRDGSHAIAQATAEISQGNQDLSVRTEIQASHLQETASSVEQMCGTLGNNADTAHQADQLAAAAAQLADEGHVAVGTLVKTMGDIQASSRRIADIIGVIDGIAFQTNILALNAAVEAARAGEQGRGFAVVASEVRALAHRSADAAREIKGLIVSSTDQVNDGSVHADHAGNAIASIVAQVKEVTGLVREIANASGQQTNGFAQISASLSEIDAATQQNSALVEQTAAAADSLRQQAGRLSSAVDVFKVA